MNAHQNKFRIINMDDKPAEECDTSELQEQDCDTSIEMGTMWECDTNPNFRGRIEAPTYNNAFSTILQEPGMEVLKKKNSAPPRNSCFNCMGGHLISECPLPRDQRAITKNRREFMNKSSGFFRQASRYHLGEDQIYAHMLPGKISKSLKHALGLSKHQLPAHIYRMRLFGYPPGWLEDARVSRSGIALYADSKGKEIPTPGDEEGEVICDASKDTYDVSKIHEFPGFNVSPEPDTVDESRYYQCPPQQRDQSKEAMIKNLELQSATSASYKKLAAMPMVSKTDETASDSGGDPNSNSLPECSNSLSKEGVPAQEDHCISPSLEDLEARKQNLIAELLIKSSTTEPPSVSNDMGTIENSDQETLSSEKSGEQTPCVSKDVDSQDEHNTHSSGDDTGFPKATEPTINSESDETVSERDSQCTPKNKGLVKHVELGSSPDRDTPYSRTPLSQTTKIGTVKQVEQGTPILKSASPFSYLPSPDNFSKDICDVINFENLPDSLGHYKRMNQVIHSVRDHLKRQ